MGLFDEQVSFCRSTYVWDRQFIQAMWDNPWNVNEFNFSRDIQDFKVRLTEEQRQVAIRALSAISQIEVSVKTFWSKLGDNLPQLRDLGCVLSNSECVHNEAYFRLLEILDMLSIFENHLTTPVISGRVNYLRKYTHRFYSDSKKQYVYALVLFTIFVENVSLFSQFYIMNWLNRNLNVFSSVNQQILYTKNEETIHFLVGAQIVNTLRQEYPELFDEELEERIVTEADNAIKHEIKLIDWLLQGFSGPNLSNDILANFVKYRMNESLTRIGFKSLYEITPEQKKEFWWFEEEVFADNFVDFFNQRSVDYSKNNKSFTEEDLF